MTCATKGCGKPNYRAKTAAQPSMWCKAHTEQFEYDLLHQEGDPDGANVIFQRAQWAKEHPEDVDGAYRSRSPLRVSFGLDER